jgi:hypothetical protein
MYFIDIAWVASEIIWPTDDGNEFMKYVGVIFGMYQ